MEEWLGEPLRVVPGEPGGRSLDAVRYSNSTNPITQSLDGANLKSRTASMVGVGGRECSPVVLDVGRRGLRPIVFHALHYFVFAPLAICSIIAQERAHDDHGGAEGAESSTRIFERHFAFVYVVAPFLAPYWAHAG